MPSDYITELAQRADAKITPEDWKANAELCDYLKEKPANALQLSQEMESLPGLQAQLAWHIGYTPSQWLVEQELVQVDARRSGQNIFRVEPSGETYIRAAKSGMMGISLSGGGIRSATFNLGVLQALAELNLLRCFDYLSSVSGGGYIHQWLAAWIQRQAEKHDPTDKVRGFDEINGMLVPPPEPNNPGIHPEPIRWLRRYSNYLTPQRGLFTADTWVGATTWLRNTLLNQIVLSSGLLFVVLLPHLLTFQSLAPQHDWAVLTAAAAISYLFLVATYFVGDSVCKISGSPNENFGQSGVQGFLVIPLLAAAVLTAFLFPISLLGINLVLSFLLATALHLIFAATIAFKGGVLVSYLKSHHRTAQYASFREFWDQRPKCFAHVRAVFAILGLCVIVVFAALFGAAWNVSANLIMAWLWSCGPRHGWELALVIGPPLALIGPMITMLVAVGLLGRTYTDSRREWLSRFAAWVGLYGLAWIVFVGFSLFSHAAITLLGPYVKTKIIGLVSWIGTTLAGVLAGKSSHTAGTTSEKTSKFSFPDLIATVSPYVFIAGLLLMVSWLADFLFTKSQSYGVVFDLLVFLVPLVVCVLFAWRVDINEFSMHAFYRNRLTRCYLGASNAARKPNPFTGFDADDAKIAMSELLPHKGYYGPYPIFCTALNLTRGQDLAWQERKAASFFFSPLYCGYDVGWTAAKRLRRLMRFNGFVETGTYAYPAPGIHINTATAISGAAVSPNMGFHSNPATAFLMTIFNVRLGWWLANPRVLAEDGGKLDRKRGPFNSPFPKPSPHFSLFQLLSELLGSVDDTSKYVMLSDGGHFDNMGVYELVRRRCRYIVICDSEEDGEGKHQGIGMAIRKCRIDFGVEIDLDLRPFESLDDGGCSASHCVVGTITYPETPHDPGIVVYLRSSLTGDEPADVLNYRKQDPVFPNDSTLNQWFTESQFESYRRLGHHAAMATFLPGRPEALQCSDKHQRQALFENLKSVWCPPTPEMQRYSADHSKLFQSLLQEIRTDTKLEGFLDLLFDRDPNHSALEWEKVHREDAEYAIRFCSKLIEFMFVVYMQLRLVFPDNLSHPFSRGWVDIFKSWSRIDVIQDSWRRYGNSYSRAFQIFAESTVKLPSANPHESEHVANSPS
ncbi:MAG TPA: hypothetical protein VMS18_15435 [Candidatus Binatia bacterium]|nr:hypothetical protein [Candidatus Binatia bacterium]